MPTLALFSIANLLVLPFWALMIVAPRWRRTAALVRSPLIVLPPMAIYAALVLPNLGSLLPVVARPTLPAVAALLGGALGAAAAWAHFLAFDLFVGRWIFLDARERGLRALPVSALLAATLLLGPLGLAGYLALRAVASRGLTARARAGSSAVGRTLRAAATTAAAGSRPLVALALASLGLLAASALAMALDARQIQGVSLWLKPAKFAASVGLTAATLALLLRHVRLPARAGRIAVGAIAGLLALELVLITVQAARGVGSHFNVATALDAAVFGVMGVAITLATVAVGFVAVAAFRQRFSPADRALGVGIRAGLVLMLLGSVIAFAMPRPTPAQLDSLRAGRPTPVIGAHAVGVSDGGAGLPVTRWSTEGGDLRVPHFIGLHGLQVLPLAGWLLGRRHRRAGTDPRLAARLTGIAGAGYLGMTATAMVGALRGRPLLAPDGVVIALALAVLVGVGLAAAAAIAASRGRERAGQLPAAGRHPAAA